MLGKCGIFSQIIDNQFFVKKYLLDMYLMSMPVVLFAVFIVLLCTFVVHLCILMYFRAIFINIFTIYIMLWPMFNHALMYTRILNCYTIQALS